jgi:hypothetical protein
METVITVILYIIIIFIDTIAVFKKKNVAINIMYLTIFIFTFIIIFLDSIGVVLPSPSLVIRGVINKFIK